MSLRAVLFNFNGVIVDDQPLHQQLVDQIVIDENLRPRPEDYWQFCLGRSDRAGLKDLLTNRGRVVTEAYLEKLIAQKSQAYQQQLVEMEVLPIFPGLTALVAQLQNAEIKLAIVSGAVQAEIQAVLDKAQLSQNFQVIVTAEDSPVSKPAPDGYLLAIDYLNQKYQGLELEPSECLVIEDTFTGITAAKQAGIPVVGVAHTYPFHMLQRQANWTVDNLAQLELDRIQAAFEDSAPE